MSIAAKCTCGTEIYYCSGKGNCPNNLFLQKINIDIAAFLLEKHTHAELLLKDRYSGRGEKYIYNPQEVLYREEDIVELIRKLGYDVDWDGNAELYKQKPI